MPLKYKKRGHVGQWQSFFAQQLGKFGQVGRRLARVRDAMHKRRKSSLNNSCDGAVKNWQGYVEYRQEPG
jgi:hypothetical protein